MIDAAFFEEFKAQYRQMREEQRARYTGGYDTPPMFAPPKPNEIIATYEVAQQKRGSASDGPGL